MKFVILALSCTAALFLLPVDYAFAVYQPPCPAPLPGLGLTLLGQLGAGALGWKFLRRHKRQSKTGERRRIWGMRARLGNAGR